MASNEAAALVVRLEATAARFERDMRRAETSFNRSASAIQRRGQSLDNSLSTVGSKFGSAFAAIARTGGAVAAAAAVAAIGKAINDVVKNGQQLRLIEGRFTALTGSAERGATALGGVLSVSQKTGVAVDDVASAMSRFTIAAQDIQRSDEEVRKFTENLLQLGRIGGSSAREISAASVQLSQGLAAGALRGEELNSVLEGMPLVARAIADELGIGIGELKNMGKEGRILSNTVFEAVLNKTQEIDEQIAKLPPTVEQAANNMAVSWAKFTAAIDASIGASASLASTINAAANALSRLTATGTEANAIALSDVGGRRGALEKQIAALERGEGVPKIPGVSAEDDAQARATVISKLKGELTDLNREYNQAISLQEKLVRGGAPAIKGPARFRNFQQTGTSDEAQAQRIAGIRSNVPTADAPRLAPQPEERGNPFRVVDIDADIKARRGGGGGGGGVTQDDAARRIADDLRERVGLLQEESQLIRRSERDRVILQAAFERERIVRELVLAAQRQGATITQDELVVAENLAAGIEEITIANYDLEESQRRAADAAKQHRDEQKKLSEDIADVSDRFANAIQQADSFADALRNIGVELANLAVQGLAGEGPLGSVLGNLIPSLIGGAAGSFAVGGGSVAGYGNPGSFVGGGSFPAGFAKGGAFGRGGKLIPFARGGIVRRPTIFPMADGMGLMGEAGPEAVLPLRMGPGGRLGVEASGGGGVSVTVINNAGVQVGVQQRETRAGPSLDVTIDKAVARQINRGGSDTRRSLGRVGQTVNR